MKISQRDGKDISRPDSPVELSLSEYPVLILDCQTTGASPASGDLLEIAWASFSASADRLPVVEDYLIEQPDGEPIPARIEALTGIGSTEMTAARKGKFVLAQLKETISQMSLPPLCLIHYARFEVPFLNDFFFRFGRRKTLPFKTICTFEIAKRLYPNLPSRGIRALGGFLGLDLDELKRAPSHVLTTCQIWKHLVERLADDGVYSVCDLEIFLSSKASARKGKLEYLLEPEKRLALPDCPGVYRMLNSRGRVLYVGKASSLRSRVNSHFRGRKRKTSTSFELLTQVKDISITRCRSPLQAALLEVDEIKKYDPPYNESLKKKNRKIWFYADDLESGRVNFDTEHPIGPFSSEGTLENLMLLIKSIADGELDPAIIYADAEEDVVAGGFELFLGKHQIEPFSDCSMLQLMCLGMRLYRSLRNLIRKSVCDPGQDCEKDDLGLDPGLEQDQDLLSDELTETEICDRIESLLIGAARSYLLARELTRLLTCRVEFDYCGAEISLEFEGGYPKDSFQSDASAGTSALESNQAWSGEIGCWSGLNIETYDRLRVLLTEILSIRSRGISISVFPYMCFLSRYPLSAGASSVVPEEV